MAGDDLTLALTVRTADVSIRRGTMQRSPNQRARVRFSCLSDCSPKS